MTTQYANASYQEVIDLHTESDKVSVVGIHTPTSDTPIEMLRGFWTQFRKFKYNGCSISLVPAAQLPADPLQVSYEAGEPTIDPRDMLNPILFHGCHGDDMGKILNSLYANDNASSFIEMSSADSADLNVFPQSVLTGDNSVKVYESLYYKALTDKTWLKAHPQRGFRKSGLHPMIYSLASTVQFGNLYQAGLNTSIYPSGQLHEGLSGDLASRNTGTFGLATNGNFASSAGYGRPTADVSAGTLTMPVTKNMESFLTPRLQRLGWMETRQVVQANSNGAVTSSTFGGLYMGTIPVGCPKVFMGMILLPPAYKTEQYYRLIINHSFSFAKFRGASMNAVTSTDYLVPYGVYNFNDPESRKHVDPEKGGDLDDGTGTGTDNDKFV